MSEQRCKLKSVQREHDRQAGRQTVEQDRQMNETKI